MNEELGRVFSCPEKMRVFVDMDGTIARWQDVPLETVEAPGYFRQLPPVETMLLAIKMLLKEDDVNVFILSSVLRDDHSQNDKICWLDEHIPEIKTHNRLFVPYGDSKTAYVPSPRPTDILIDDYSANLREWHGIGVKCMNGINGTHGTWEGKRINADSPAETITDSIRRIIKEVV